MDTEFEATFANVDKDDIRTRLRKAGATLERPEYMQRRVPFYLPGRKDEDTTWLRVRDEGDKVTMSLKAIQGDRIEDQKETCLEVSDYDQAVLLLEQIGCEPKSYQESKRELWSLDGADVTIDEWPLIEPFVEVEGASEEIVRAVAENIGFAWNDALFCAVGKLYEMKYGITPHEINTVPRLVFGMDNPFLKSTSRMFDTKFNKS